MLVCTRTRYLPFHRHSLHGLLALSLARGCELALEEPPAPACSRLPRACRYFALICSPRARRGPPRPPATHHRPPTVADKIDNSCSRNFCFSVYYIYHLYFYIKIIAKESHHLRVPCERPQLGTGCAPGGRGGPRCYGPTLPHYPAKRQCHFRIHPRRLTLAALSLSPQSGPGRYPQTSRRRAGPSGPGRPSQSSRRRKAPASPVQWLAP
jgi:hypothetical protein